MASGTQSDKVARSVTTNLTAFKVMYMQFNDFLCGGMSTAALTGVVVAFQNVLAYIVFVVHFTELVVSSNWKWLSGEHCL